MKNKKQVRTQEMAEPVKCSVSDSLSLMFRLSRLTGLAPVRFDGRRVSVSRNLWVVHCVILTVMNLAGLYGFIYDMSVDLDDAVHAYSVSSKIMWILDYGLVMVIATAAVYTASIRTEQIIRSLSTIQKIKKGIIRDQMTDFKWLERSKIACVVLFLAFGTSVLLTDWFIIVIKPSLDKGIDILVLALYANYEVAYVMIFVLEVQFFLSTFETYDAFKVLNNALENASNRHAERRYVTYPKIMSIEDTIGHFAAAYSGLCAALKTLEKAFGAVLIIVLLCCLLHMINAPINVISSILGGGGVGVDVSWCILHFVRTMVLMEPPQWIQFEMDRTRFLVNELILQNTDMPEDLDKFHRYLQLNSATYSPMGLCTLGRPLFASMLGTVVTYAVIITQLSGKV